MTHDWTRPLHYHSDDLDLPTGNNDLVVFMGENGDWYVSIVAHGEKLGPCVRVTTSGQRLHGMVHAMATLYRALAGEPTRPFVDFDAWMGRVREGMQSDLAASLRANVRVAGVSKDVDPAPLETIRQRYERCVYMPNEPSDEQRLQMHRDIWTLIAALEESERVLGLATDEDAKLAEVVQLRNDKDKWELRALTEENRRKTFETDVQGLTEEMESMARRVDDLVAQLARVTRTPEAT